jgi:hypothetical protein
MVTQLFKSSVYQQPALPALDVSANIIALPCVTDSFGNFTLSVPVFPNNSVTPIHMHKYKGRFRETFVVEGSPYGDQWLSEATASVETEAVKLLAIFKALNPTGLVFLLGSLLPLLLLWFAV